MDDTSPRGPGLASEETEEFGNKTEEFGNKTEACQGRILKNFFLEMHSARHATDRKKFIAGSSQNCYKT